ncbi:MAG: element excision factor XisI family protein [Bacteroidota bacterium]
MEKVDQYKVIITEVVARPASSKTINQPSLRKYLQVDKSKHNFLLFNAGWHKEHYIHDLLFHIELTNDGDVRILENNTDYPLEDQLLKAGVASDDLHMAWVQVAVTNTSKNEVKEKNYRKAVENLMNRMAGSKSINAPALKKQVITDDEEQNYTLFSSGWHDNRYVYDLLLRLEIRDHQIWIHKNNTDYPLEAVLLEAGVAKADLIFAWEMPYESDQVQIAV